MLAYRDWTIKKWGAKQYAKLENHGNFVGTLGFHWLDCSCILRWIQKSDKMFSHLKSHIMNISDVIVFCLVLDVESCEQDLARLMLVSVEDQRDTSSPLSADSPSPSPVFLPSPQHHSSSSSACSLSSSSSGSDIVRPKDILSIETFNRSVTY